MLANIQDKMLHSLLSTKIEDLDFIKSFNGIMPAERLLIHRQTILENFVNSLKISYPGVWKLLGEPCARGAALAYAHDLANIPSAGKMAEFGANFPLHLKDFPSTCDLTYLPDFAKLEWLRSLCFDAPNEVAVLPQELAKIELDDLEKYRFIFNASVFFMKSDFPLVKIQELVDGANNSAFDLAHEESYNCVYRFENRVNTAWLNKASWYFLKGLSEGKTLGAAAANLEIDLEAMFSFIFTRGFIVNLIPFSRLN